MPTSTFSFLLRTAPINLVHAGSSYISIHGSSFIPFSHKSAAIHRLLSAPLIPRAFEEKEGVIHHIAGAKSSNNFDIIKMIFKKLIRKATDSATAFSRSLPVRSNKKWIRLPYLRISQNSTLSSPSKFLIFLPLKKENIYFSIFFPDSFL